MSRHMSFLKKKESKKFACEGKRGKKSGNEKNRGSRCILVTRCIITGVLSSFLYLALSLKGEGCWVSRVKACALCLVILCRPATKIRSRCFSPELDERLSLLQIGPPEARKCGIAVLMN